MRKRFVFSSTLLAGLVLSGVALACPFCQENKGPTLVGDFKQADMVMVGKFIKARPGKAFEYESDFKVMEVLKPHAFLKGKDVITVPRYQLNPNAFLIYADLFKGELDPYRGHELLDKGETLAYIKGAVKLADAPPQERLKYAFNYLQSDDYEVSLDAYREFAQADYKDYKDMAVNLPADTIADWLKSPKTAPYRYGLYASLLGHAGLKEASKYGAMLKDMIEDPEKRKGSGIDGLLAGYAMLQPREALDYLKKNLANSKEEFLLRYACLRTARFMWEQRPDLIPEKDLVECMVLVARLPDMSDFAIEDLRRWNRWESTPAILDLFEKSSHDTTLIKRSILRFALHAAAQKNEAAAKWVAAQDANWVSQVSKILERELDLKAPYQRTK